MIRDWFDLSDERRREIFYQTSQRAALPPWSVEKDWWASMVLKSLFELDFSEQLVFKGGTSLSKGWNLIQRFSEDIDIAINMKYLGFEGDPTLKKITKLRKASYAFTRDTLCETLDAKLEEAGFIDFKLAPNEEPNTSTDPHSLNLYYQSLTQLSEYISSSVKLEVSARSLMEPTEEREIQSFVGNHFPGQRFADSSVKLVQLFRKERFSKKPFCFMRNLNEIRKKCDRKE